MAKEAENRIHELRVELERLVAYGLDHAAELVRAELESMSRVESAPKGARTPQDKQRTA